SSSLFCEASMRRSAPACLLCLSLLLLTLLAPRGRAAWPWRRPRCRPVELCPCSPAESAEEAVRRVLEDQVAAWNQGDLEGFMAGYWQSPELSFFSGKERTRGWQATLDRYRKRYQAGGQEMGTLRFEEVQVRVLGPDAVLATGRWQLERKKDKPGGLFTLLFRRLPEGWRIVHDHTSG